MYNCTIVCFWVKASKPEQDTCIYQGQGFAHDDLSGGLSLAKLLKYY